MKLKRPTTERSLLYSTKSILGFDFSDFIQTLHSPQQKMSIHCLLLGPSPSPKIIKRIETIFALAWSVNWNEENSSLATIQEQHNKQVKECNKHRLKYLSVKLLTFFIKVITTQLNDAQPSLPIKNV